jgi:tetratricopeptide (TPR) repeat protein
VLHPTGDEIHYLVDPYSALRTYEEALKLFRQVGDKLGEANVLQAIGDVQQFRKETNAALESYEEALKLFRQVGDKLGEANVLQSLGTERLSQNDPVKAFEYYELAQIIYEKIEDKYSQSRNNLFVAQANISRKEYDKAMIALISSANLAEEIKVITLRQAALSQLVAVSKEIKSWDALNSVLIQLIDSHPTDVGLINHRANSLYEQKNYEEALTVFRHASQMAPDDSSIWNGIGNALESLKHYEEAFEAYTLAINNSPDHAYLLRNRANILLELNRLDEAEKDIAKSFVLEPNSPYTHARQGYLALAQGNFAEAVLHFEFAVGNDDSKSWKIGLALSKFALGEMDKAQELLTIALLDTEEEEREDSRKWLERIVKLNPNSDASAQIVRDMLA